MSIPPYTKLALATSGHHITMFYTSESFNYPDIPVTHALCWNDH